MVRISRADTGFDGHLTEARGGHSAGRSFMSRGTGLASMSAGGLTQRHVQLELGLL